jgi:hypothetical protein
MEASMTVFADLIDALRQFRRRPVAPLVPAASPLSRGLLAGTIGAAGTAVLMQRAQIVGGINPADGVTYVAVAVILTLAAIAAAFVPARRALRIEPAVALRAE